MKGMPVRINGPRIWACKELLSGILTKLGPKAETKRKPVPGYGYLTEMRRSETEPPRKASEIRLNSIQRDSRGARTNTHDLLTTLRKPQMSSCGDLRRGSDRRKNSGKKIPETRILQMVPSIRATIRPARSS